MKRLAVLLLSTLVITSLAYSQKIKNQAKVKELLGEEAYSQNLAQNPGKIKYLSAFESDGYSIESLPSDKQLDTKTLIEIPLKCSKKGSKEKTSVTVEQFLKASSSDDFNILMYNLHADPNKVAVYKLGSTGKVLIIQSTKRISAIANKLEL